MSWKTDKEHLQIGDMATIDPNLSKSYNAKHGWTVVTDMLKYAGKSSKIVDYKMDQGHVVGYYLEIDKHQYIWEFGMLI